MRIDEPWASLIRILFVGGTVSLLAVGYTWWAIDAWREHVGRERRGKIRRSGFDVVTRVRKD